MLLYYNVVGSLEVSGFALFARSEIINNNNKSCARVCSVLILSTGIAAGASTVGLLFLARDVCVCCYSRDGASTRQKLCDEASIVAVCREKYE